MCIETEEAASVVDKAQTDVEDGLPLLASFSVVNDGITSANAGTGDGSLDQVFFFTRVFAFPDTAWKLYKYLP